MFPGKSQRWWCSKIHQSGGCLPSLKKLLRPSLSCRFLEYTENERNLIGQLRRLWTKEHNTGFSSKTKPRVGVLFSCHVFYFCIKKLIPITKYKWVCYSPDEFEMINSYMTLQKRHAVVVILKVSFNSLIKQIDHTRDCFFCHQIKEFLLSLSVTMNSLNR